MDLCSTLFCYYCWLAIQKQCSLTLVSFMKLDIALSYLIEPIYPGFINTL